MSLPAGTYFIQPVDRPESFVGVGPVPPIYPPFPAPLRAVDSRMKDMFVIEPASGDEYYIRHKTTRLNVGFDNQNNLVRLNPMGTKDVTWAVDRGNGPEQYRMHVPNSNGYWTAPEENFGMIELKGAQGSPTQEWRLIRIERD